LRYNEKTQDSGMTMVLPQINLIGAVRHFECHTYRRAVRAAKEPWLMDGYGEYVDVATDRKSNAGDLGAAARVWSAPNILDSWIVGFYAGELPLHELVVNLLR
jgi:hypothetical protein